MHQTLIQYAASPGICKITNQPTRDEMVRQAMQRFFARNVELNDGLFCCRMLVGKGPNDMTDDPTLAVFILQKDNSGQPQMNLLLWSEAEERNLDKVLMSLIDHSQYEEGPGKALYPDKIPKGERT